MLGIKNADGKWLQIDATIAKHVDTFGRLALARTFDNRSYASNIKTRLEHVGFGGIEICECNPSDDLTIDNDISGLIEA